MSVVVGVVSGTPVDAVVDSGTVVDVVFGWVGSGAGVSEATISSARLASAAPMLSCAQVLSGVRHTKTVNEFEVKWKPAWPAIVVSSTGNGPPRAASWPV